MAPFTDTVSRSWRGSRHVPLLSRLFSRCISRRGVPAWYAGLYLGPGPDHQRAAAESLRCRCVTCPRQTDIQTGAGREAGPHSQPGAEPTPCQGHPLGRPGRSARLGSVVLGSWCGHLMSHSDRRTYTGQLSDV